MQKPDGYTLIEMLVVLAISSLLLTLGASAVRHFWLVQSLDGATDSVVTQMRELQERAVSESHPLIYGARFREGSGDWGLIRYNPNGAGTGLASCVQYATRSFSAGLFSTDVAVTNADFANRTAESDDDDLPAANAMQSFCATNLRNSSGTTIANSDDEFVLFYARGSATTGRLELTERNLARKRNMTVSGMTGRVTRS